MSTAEHLGAAPEGIAVDFRDPRGTALALAEHVYSTKGVRSCHFWQGEFHEWDGAAYRPLPTSDIRAFLYSVGKPTPVKKRHVDDVVDALKAVLNLSDRLRAPAWWPDRSDPPNPVDMIALANGVLHAPTRYLYPPTPSFVTTTARPFAYTPGARRPVSWLTFLRDLWGDDETSVQLLREWFGYNLVQRCEQQKALLLVGPKRAGKGTILRVLAALVGRENVASPGLSSLATPFGMACLLGKSAAFVSDARLSNRSDMAVIAENLLRLTGEDDVTVERKYRDPVTVRPTVRFTFAANALPAFTDASSALPGRLLILPLARSFYGVENHHLTARLLEELPGIFAWALDGLDSLNERGRFQPPDASVDLVEEMDELAAPVRVFVAEMCELDPAAEEPVKTLFEAWQGWCRGKGRDRPGSEQLFGRDLRAAFPFLRVARPRVDNRQVRHYAGLRLIR